MSADNLKEMREIAIRERELDALEKRIHGHRILQVVRRQVRRIRAKYLALPIPRGTCPGCFSAIYDGAAKQGWCCNCFPQRKRYEANP